MESQPQLPQPVVTSEMFLYAIVYELRRMNDLLAQLVPATVQPVEIPSVSPDEDGTLDEVVLREPVKRRKGK